MHPLLAYSVAGDFPHDVILAAAMLLVVLSNTLHSDDPIHGCLELMTHWFSHTAVKPFPKLAMCYALLAKIPPAVLMGVVIRGGSLMLALFPVICDLFDGYVICKLV